ncbi:MAG: glycosyltransferase family 2 protein, partial [Thermoplasmata archaeon]|nr:glycosyltransferase family 2 protein [Thermoplasmata archaeon]
MTLVSVIIPTWNGLPLLRACLAGLSAQSHRELEIIVVDDGSTDGTAEFVRGLGATVRAVVLPGNRGFAVAMNAGFRAARGEQLIALNNDAVPDPEFVAEMVGSSSEGFDMVASRVVLADSEFVDSAGITVLRDGGSRERLRNAPADSPSVERRAEVFGPSAAASLYSRAMLEEVGGFDESFEAYYEDVDLAWRGRIAGFRCVYNPMARVRHVHSATWGRLSRRKLFLLERNRLWTLWKDYPA